MASRRPVRPGAPEEERLPWLEDAPVAAPPRGRGWSGRIVILVLLAVAVLGAALWWWRSGGVAGGDGGLIRAPAGPYKVRPPEAGGMRVEGQGFSSFSASEGGEPAGAIDLSAVPEAPLANPRGAPPKEGAAIEPKAPPPPAEATGGPGTVVQLGAFSSEGKAKEAWKGLSGRFAFLTGMEPVIAVASVDGATVYRLRSVMPSPAYAAQVCGRMRVAGETCLVVGQ